MNELGQAVRRRIPISWVDAEAWLAHCQNGQRTRVWGHSPGAVATQSTRRKSQGITRMNKSITRSPLGAFYIPLRRRRFLKKTQ